jgi:hypothetical protein
MSDASRLSGVAKAGEIIGDRKVAGMPIEDARLAWAPVGTVSPKGLPAMEVYALDYGAGPADELGAQHG